MAASSVEVLGQGGTVTLGLLPKLRKRMSPSLRSNTIYAYNTLTHREHEDQPYTTSNAHTQTTANSSSSPESLPAPTQLVYNPPGESHLRTSFTDFCDAAFGAPPPSLPKAAERLSKSDTFLAYRKQYIETYDHKKLSPTYPHDPDIELMRLFNLILVEARDCGFTQRYAHDIHYAKRISAQTKKSRSGSSPTPQCLGVDAQATDNGALQFEFSNALVIIEANTSLIPVPGSDESRSWTPSSHGSPQPSLATAFSIHPPHHHSPGGMERRRREPILDTSVGFPYRTQKRQRSNHVVDSIIPAQNAPPSAVQDDPPFLKQYALSTLSSVGNRRHVLGFHINGLDFQFWYFDRAGSICSSTVNILHQSKQFITSIIQLSLADKECLGYEALFRAPMGSKRRSWSDIRDHEVEVEGHWFKLISVVHSSSSLYGRGTSVYEATKIPSTASSHSSGASFSESDHVVVKLSWQPVSKHLEDGLYRLAHEKGVKGLAALHASCTAFVLSEGHIRRTLCKVGSYQDRELRAQVLSPFCVPLYTVESIDTFKEAFVSLVEAHRELYNKAGILHRDISYNNLMVDSNDHTRGILIDLDMAVRDRNPGTGEVLDVPALPGGTVAFRSADLCGPEPLPRALYRHDLESFFYVLFLMCYERADIPEKRDYFSNWSSGTWADVRASKEGWLLIAPSAPIPDAVPLVTTWIQPLRLAFRNGYSSRNRRSKRLLLKPDLQSPFDDQTLGDHITYDQFITILKAPGL
ncbi:uncharacterized protein EI90DRAFT_81962 [Cantharellus anzutake]|uniref:uncharacterized protein n=1 Tax=Cantharellus anzutake TaxID=1750568 RepID=UPI0019031018|nr:uncharacterized protein EI90DRAFT_81962 [Cantharellus anzutake]KAF8336882.1 hypothetical protein EI90DRAFT_81962 [Cantharellus anzutake]